MAVAHRLVPLLVSALVIALMSLSPGEAAEAQSKKSSAATKKPVSKSKTSKTASSSPAKKSPSRSGTATTKKSAPSKKSTASSHKAASKSAKKKSAKRSPRVVKPRGQQEPTPERYKEIQQALIDRGYLAPPPTGVWGPESVAALRRFQQEQNLQATGKLDSLSLIALGLGPKYSATAQVRPNHENRSTQGNQGP